MVSDLFNLPLVVSPYHHMHVFRKNGTRQNYVPTCMACVRKSSPDRSCLFPIKMHRRVHQSAFCRLAQASVMGLRRY